VHNHQVCVEHTMKPQNVHTHSSDVKCDKHPNYHLCAASGARSRNHTDTRMGKNDFLTPKAVRRAAERSPCIDKAFHEAAREP
jgi:hypothetical protein